MSLINDLYGAPMAAILHLPPWLGYLAVGLVLMYTIGLAGMVAAKAGHSPLWALALLVPYLNVLVLWLFAYVEWPALNRRR